MPQLLHKNSEWKTNLYRIYSVDHLVGKNVIYFYGFYYFKIIFSLVTNLFEHKQEYLNYYIAVSIDIFNEKGYLKYSAGIL